MAERITQQTLFLFFEGRATSLQRKLIEDWLKDTANEEVYFRALEAWERQHPQLPDATAEAENRFFSYLCGQTVPAKSISKPFSENTVHWSFQQYGLIAASVALVLLMGLAFLFQDTLRYQQYKTDYGETRPLLLADGSQVTMNANSVLKVPRWQNQKAEREVWLSGEAEFKVIHTIDHRRFIVRTRNNLSVDVVGTIFSVYDRGAKAAVSLLKGKVNVHYGTTGPKQQVVTLEPGNRVTLSERGKLSLTTRIDPQIVTAWKNHQFVFNNTTLLEILQLIQENYGVTVRLTDARLSKKRITGTFTAQNARELLDVLAEMYTLQLQADQDSFILLSPSLNSYKSNTL